MKCSMFRVAALAGLAVSSSVLAGPGAPRAKATANADARAEVIRPTVMTKLPSDSPAVVRDLKEAQGLDHSVAYQWIEMLLHGIRNDFARPTAHARNLYHHSAAMWDAWAAYDAVADQALHSEKLDAPVDVQAAREEAISYAMYRLMSHRFANAPRAHNIFPEMDLLMADLGYDTSVTTTIGDSPAALGNRIAQTIINYGLTDGSNEANGYANTYYFPFNPPLAPALPGNPDLFFPSRWQPLTLEVAKDQGGNPIPGDAIPFLSPEWGNVEPFALDDSFLTVRERDFFQWNVWVDPGAPPTWEADRDEYRWTHEMVSVWSSHMDPTDGVMIDISPATIGNNVLPEMSDQEEFYQYIEGGDWSRGWDLNPVTGEPYEPQIVPRGDYGRILAEFWADGPDSETPPGHWFTILNHVMDHPLFEKRFMGQGEIMDELEFDVKAYVSLGGAMHDVAISAWSVKGFYDYLRPISAIRWLADNGQCTDPLAANYSEDGIELVPDKIELVTSETTAPGGKHEHLAGYEGKIAVKAWRGPSYITDPDTDFAGVGWILAENWWPYQRPSFVTPPFAGYVSGHSTFSRSAAELMTLLTGSEFFPGGMGVFDAPQNEFLVFEEGPSVDCELQWATYVDASDQCSLSRIWGGIHPPADDIPGRHMGIIIGPNAFHHARKLFNGQISCPADFNADGALTVTEDINGFIAAIGAQDPIADFNGDGETDFFDFAGYLNTYMQGCD